MKIELDFELLTVDDLEELEEACDGPVMGLLMSGDIGKFSPKMLKALVWVLGRKQDPSFTIEQAGQVPLSELGDDEEEPVDPTKAEPASS